LARSCWLDGRLRLAFDRDTVAGRLGTIGSRAPAEAVRAWASALSPQRSSSSKDEQRQRSLHMGIQIGGRLFPRPL
jgi:hypothetical protein